MGLPLRLPLLHRLFNAWILIFTSTLGFLTLSCVFVSIFVNITILKKPFNKVVFLVFRFHLYIIYINKWINILFSQAHFYTKFKLKWSVDLLQMLLAGQPQKLDFLLKKMSESGSRVSIAYIPTREKNVLLKP